MSAIPCKTSPIKGLFSSMAAIEEKIRELENQGGVDLSGYVTDTDLSAALTDKADVGHEHDYVTDGELETALDEKSDVGHTHDVGVRIIATHYGYVDNYTTPLSTSAGVHIYTPLNLSVPATTGQTIDVWMWASPFRSGGTGVSNLSLFLDANNSVVGGACQAYRNDTTNMVMPSGGFYRFDGLGNGTHTIQIKYQVNTGTWLMGDTSVRPVVLYAQVLQ